MIDRRENGGLIGPYKTANINSANGMWSVYDQFMFKASNNWPGISILNGVEFIVIAGGGGGGSTHAGGGGAGGYRAAVVGESSGGGGANEGNLVAYLNNPYPISIGGGGAAGADRPFNGANGTTSYFATISCVGGGGGGSEYKTGLGGGSGGGHATTGTLPSAQGTANQGYAAGIGGPGFRGGGGGGAGGIGQDGTTAAGGSGGLGIQSSISGAALFYAGGGAGGGYGGTAGVGGSGVGGNGNNGSGTQTSGATNTGSGGGGGGYPNGGGGNGGSGVVIIKTPTGINASFTGGITFTSNTTASPGFIIHRVTAGTGTVTFT